MVVRPVAAVQVAVGRAGAVIEFRADQHVHRQAVVEDDLADLAAGNRGQAGEAADHPAFAAAVEDLAVAGNQHADVVVLHERTGQGGGDVAQSAGLDEIGELRRDEQYLAALLRRQPFHGMEKGRKALGTGVLQSCASRQVAHVHLLCVLPVPACPAGP
ncbi:hypothetical protein D3C76_881150 [compost metagenome]